jgi:hypothetical protein
MVWFTQADLSTACAGCEWNGRQAVLFDIVERKFYIFGLVFWPQDVFYPRHPADHLGLSPCSCSPPSAAACGAAMLVRRRSTRKSSPGSNRRSKASAMRASNSMRRP